MNGAKTSKPSVAVRDERLINRSVVEPGKKYGEYRQTLRHDFFHSCAYCTIMESEAQSVGMVIDHYEPQKDRPDLTNNYDNLIYSCSVCNERKSDRYPPPEGRQDGKRFFRPDLDVRSEHFSREALLLEAKTELGKFNIQALHLNRAMLTKLRSIRRRASACDQLITGGVADLRSFPIDRLPQHIKGQAATTIGKVVKFASSLQEDLEAILRGYAKSELIDPDPNIKEWTRNRDAYFREQEALYPGKLFRSPRGRRTPS